MPKSIIATVVMYSSQRMWMEDQKDEQYADHKKSKTIMAEARGKH